MRLADLSKYIVERQRCQELRWGPGRNGFHDNEKDDEDFGGSMYSGVYGGPPVKFYACDDRSSVGMQRQWEDTRPVVGVGHWNEPVERAVLAEQWGESQYTVGGGLWAQQSHHSVRGPWEDSCSTGGALVIDETGSFALAAAAANDR